MIEQGTEEWFEARRGCATASMFSAVMAKGEGKTRKAYMLKLAAERLTGKVAESFSNAHTERGTEQEPFARLAYEAHIGEIVETVGFIKHPELMAGSSPDGLVDVGGCEIKSVIPTVQIETVMRGGFPSGHKPQIMGNLWITGRPWWDFVSYSPDMPENLRLYVFRVERDEAYIAEIESEVRRFLDELDKMVDSLR
jgi:hypothetical protein